MVSTTGAPAASTEAVKGGLRRALESAADRAGRHGVRSAARAVALRAGPVWNGDSHITLTHDGAEVRARVAPAPTVLAALAELSAPRAEDEYLVLLTECDEAELGESVLSRLLVPKPLTVSAWDLVSESLGIRTIDPRLYSRQWDWLAEPLLDSGTPPRKGAAVLRLEDALQHVMALRFGRESGEPLDAAALLDWTRRPDLVHRFTELRQVERDGLRAAAERAVGAVARTVFRLLDRDQVHDTLPIGIAIRELLSPAATGTAAREARARAEERFFGDRPPGETELARFAESCESSLLRLTDGDGHDQATAICRRAEELLSALRADTIAAASDLLDAGRDARLAAVGAEIRTALPAPLPQDLPPVENALAELREHRAPRHGDTGIDVATTAVRVIRWLATGTRARAAGETRVATLLEGVESHIRDWAWLDRALSHLRHSPIDVPTLREACRELYTAARDRRAELDRAFADRLAAWSEAAAPTEELLLVENLLERVARPLAAQRAPLILVLDGMSAEDATRLAGQAAARINYREAGRTPKGREGALATIPSTTTHSRASLLTGSLTTGGQNVERAGFAELWRKRSWGGRGATVYYQRDGETQLGERIAEPLDRAIDDTEQVVAVVLNTIDDALDTAGEPSAEGWTLGRIANLPQLLDAAARAKRPVLLTSDHGHVWDRDEATVPVHAERARYRTGEPGAGEITIRGPRVLTESNETTVPWDERIRYTRRREGYHGGVSAAEMVVPVIVLTPNDLSLPRDWRTYRPERHEPHWWSAPPPTEPAPETPPRAAPERPEPQAPPEPDHDGGLFDVAAARAEPAPAAPRRTEGARVVASATYRAGYRQVSRPPRDDEVASAIDTLLSAGGENPRLPVGRVAQAMGRPSYRAVHALKALAKLLNVDAFPVLTLVDGERAVELDRRLLTEQFLREDREETGR